MLSSHTLSLAIHRNWVDLYETIWKPEFFPKWASGLSQGPLEPDGNGWKGRGPQGPVKVRFTEHNPFCIMDHYIDSGYSKEIFVPMRIVANEEGSQVLITVFRQPLLSDEKFAQELEWVKRDLQALHKLLTT
ncbi:polyketide cyclase [Erwinia rhapontici]|uniref:polyketide cyclase n=1 Tax=Erwinia rhapontici TaxID=55212 RepID=UPI001D0DAE2B|nr:polyketide cyclase [Erwinia rhapontici]UDQ80440.1 polyketide cyclase [Erwinia rhapontici]